VVGVIGIIAFLTVLGLSLVIMRVATVALTLTGLSEESARFQVWSAFTGTGFTTSEAEHVVNHPVRRRIVMLIMTLRSAGLVSIIISLILSFVEPGGDPTRVIRLIWLLIGVGILWVISKSKTVDRYLRRLIEWALRRWTDLDVRDYASLLRLSGEYRVMEVQVREGDWVANKTLRSCYLPQEGITVLGIIRDDGSYIGGPKGDTKIYPGDTLILYGRKQELQQLDKRRAGAAGDAAHKRAVREQQKYIKEQDRMEDEYKKKREETIK